MQASVPTLTIASRGMPKGEAQAVPSEDKAVVKVAEVHLEIDSNDVAGPNSQESERRLIDGDKADEEEKTTATPTVHKLTDEEVELLGFNEEDHWHFRHGNATSETNNEIQPADESSMKAASAKTAAVDSDAQ